MHFYNWEGLAGQATQQTAEVYKIRLFGSPEGRWAGDGRSFDLFEGAQGNQPQEPNVSAELPPCRPPDVNPTAY